MLLPFAEGMGNFFGELNNIYHTVLLSINTGCTTHPSLPPPRLVLGVRVSHSSSRGLNDAKVWVFEWTVLVQSPRYSSRGGVLTNRGLHLAWAFRHGQNFYIIIIYILIPRLFVGIISLTRMSDFRLKTSIHLLLEQGAPPAWPE